jgi:COP9 signalosome complex subunit 4
MRSAKVTEALASIPSSSTDQAAAGYESLLGNIKSLSSPATITNDLNAIADSFLPSALGVVATRSVLKSLIATLRDLGNNELWIVTGQHILDHISASTSATSSLLEQAAAVRELIAEAHEQNDDFLDAAKILADIPLDSSQRRVSDTDKARIWIRIVRNFLEADDSTSAETYLNKLKGVMHSIDDPELYLHFKLSAARIQDSNRQFLAAAQSYHDISFSSVVAEDERLHTLGMAIKCAILAPAGPTRSRVLGRLYKDERAAGLEEFGMLEKMFLDRLLAPAEVDKFAKGLQPHQLATTADGSTVLAKAVVEHNLLSASRLYRNISFAALALLLGLDADKAEDTTAMMIEQRRLAGQIDQIRGIIWFEGGQPSAERGSGRADMAVGKEIRRWDANIQCLAEEVEAVANSLRANYPAFVDEYLVV